MLNITELRAKATSNGMSIVDTSKGLYQIYYGDHAIGRPQDISSLQNADKWGLFEDMGDDDEPVWHVAPRQEPISFLCTNGANSSLKVKALDATHALMVACYQFNNTCDYILPISVSSECGLTGATLPADNMGDDYNDVEYADEELGLNDDV